MDKKKLSAAIASKVVKRHCTMTAERKSFWSLQHVILSRGTVKLNVPWYMYWTPVDFYL